MTNPPHFKGFRPIGLHDEQNPIFINYEEYEAIRLSDAELHGQVEAAKIMDVSRPTFARIYESARRKIAQAFVQGKSIVFEGGKVYFDSEWLLCRTCGCSFNHIKKDLEVKNCALCGSPEIEQYVDNRELVQNEDVCICPHCGNQRKHKMVMPCKKEYCPECNCPMIRHSDSQ